MAGAEWKFVVSTLGGANVGEVTDAFERTVTRALSAPSTAGFKVYANHPLLGALIQGDLNLKCYRNGILTFHGPIGTIELAADDPSVTPTLAVVAADPSWRFDKRVSGKSGTGTLQNGVDRLTIAETAISTSNADNSGAGETGVRTLGQTCGSTAVYYIGPYKKLSEVIGEMGSTLSGFDWRIDPTEWSAGASLVGKIGNFKAANLLGTQRPAAVFEYQGRANAKTPNFKKTMDKLANSVFSIPDDGPTSALGVRNVTDAPSIAARGLYEDVVDTSGLAVLALRDAVLNDHILYRKYPQQILTFTPDFDDLTGAGPVLRNRLRDWRPGPRPGALQRSAARRRLRQAVQDAVRHRREQHRDPHPHGGAGENNGKSARAPRARFRLTPGEQRLLAQEKFNELEGAPPAWPGRFARTTPGPLRIVRGIPSLPPMVRVAHHHPRGAASRPPPTKRRRTPPSPSARPPPCRPRPSPGGTNGFHVVAEHNYGTPPSTTQARVNCIGIDGTQTARDSYVHFIAVGPA